MQKEHTINQRLFLFINRSVGTYLWLDRLMIFSARWLVYILGCAFTGAAAVLLQDHALPLLLGTARLVVAALLLNWLVALIFRHPRPQIELPHIRVLVEPKQTFKSFPSDHATVAVIFSVIGILLTLHASPIIPGFFAVSAMLIALARVYVGVHYPRDILGGLVFGMIYLWIFWGFL